MSVHSSGKWESPRIRNHTCGEECRRDDEYDVPCPEGAGEVVLQEEVRVGEDVVHHELHVQRVVLDRLVRGLKRGTSFHETVAVFLPSHDVLPSPLVGERTSALYMGEDVFPESLLFHIRYSGDECLLAFIATDSVVTWVG